VAPVLAAHLADSARVVRVSAAEALFNMGMTTIEGPAGAALKSAQDEWAEALRTFEDEVHDRVTLGWLEAARGRPDSAARELTAALKLDPSSARAHVYLGILDARAGRYAQALQHFNAAKSSAPDYPNIDRLIDEAQKRR
jgi:tetratricopeptide (TPR) repeat protein